LLSLLSGLWFSTMVIADSGIQGLIPSQAAQAAGTISIPEGNASCSFFPATASAGWKESGVAGELLHLGPTRNSSLSKE
jgi:hypothetical protein